VIYKIELNREELNLLKSIVKHNTKLCFETLSEVKKNWDDVRPMLDYTWEHVFLIDKLDRARPSIRKDNLAFFGNFENKESIEDFYKSQ